MHPGKPAGSDPRRIEPLLARHGIQATPQRVRVAELLFSRDQHLTADEVIQALGWGGSHVSKATVYNTLNLFAEKGLIKALALDGERGVFDSNTEPHHHIYVEDTGEVIDMPPGVLEFPQLPPLPAGTELVAVEVVIRVRRRG